jgi:predicted phage-related endonuclease
MTRLSNAIIQQWLDERHNSIGGSEAAAIAGNSNWDTPLSVYLKKSGLVEPEAPTTRLKVGLMAEPMIRDLTMDYLERTNPGRYQLITDGELMRAWLKRYHSESGLKLQIHVFGEGEASILLVRHPDYPRCHASPDGLLLDTVTGKLWVWEAKTSSEFMRKEWYSGVPLYYQTQASHNAAVMGLQGTYLSALIGFGDDQYHFIPEPQAPMENLEFLSSWYEGHIVEGNEPPATEKDTAILKKLNPDDGAPPIQALELPSETMEEICELDRKYIDVEAKKKEALEEWEGIRNRIKQVMGKSNELHLPSGACWTHRKGARGRTLNRRKAEHE